MKLESVLVALSLTLAPGAWAASGHTEIASRDRSVHVPILVYHHFGAVARDEMTVRVGTLAWQLHYLQEHGYRTIWLRDYVRFRLGEAPPPPPRSVILTADDGRRSVFTDLFPLVRALRMRVTLFVYPSAISNASYAMTWAQLATLVRTGLFQVESHTYWHPDFNIERRRLDRAQYALFVARQLTLSKRVLERRLGIHVDMLSWPFGIYDPFLMRQARAAGYVAAVTIERRAAGPDDPLLALPRYIVTDADVGARFARLLGGASTRGGAAAVREGRP